MGVVDQRPVQSEPAQQGQRTQDREPVGVQTVDQTGNLIDQAEHLLPSRCSWVAATVASPTASAAASSRQERRLRARCQFLAPWLAREQGNGYGEGDEREHSHEQIDRPPDEQELPPDDDAELDQRLAGRYLGGQLHG